MATPIDVLVEDIDSTVANRAEWLVSGNAATYGEYQQTVGFVKALRSLRERAMELSKEADDE